ncbi:uncharacterized protein LOC107885883 isoform X2 [Acyrthosiphon pisum]|uniref:Myb/SANT-like DNA-binding domain-containing protein n=1 Tax=Acyrthosiphon pisum TaxID=7029 RepID=A0A8R2H9S9_ACYPI|nr:uncharacterized protein LOC107885883 isoform X2 [Acyrthosiphon pisum]|eukprot:XP_016665080.1 PREDICTED: uncharacterized protein LOC107885883 isoform X2 [Acyrthosiphon pisum]
MFPQVTVKCPICNVYIISDKMSEHLKSHSQDHKLVPQHITTSKRTSLFDNLSSKASDDQELVPQHNITKSKRTSLFENLSTETSDDQELVPQHITKFKRTSLFDNLSSEASDDQELVPQHITKFKRTSLFDNLSSEASDDQELVPQHITKSKGTSLFDNLSTETSTNEKRIKNWTKSETLCLIEAYENNISIFESNSKKNRLGWIQISKDLKKKQIEYTEDQCQGKFKYLLLCYKKKLDNRHETGSAVYAFEFFNELDELFGKKPNIKPKHLASSSRVYNGLKESDGILNEDNVASPKPSSNTPPEAKKQKKNPSVHEAAIQKRHDEKMAMSQLALDTYQKYMDKILEKL